MKYREMSLAGVWLLEPEPIADERGSFERLWGLPEALAVGIDDRPMVQVSLTRNHRAGTLRGLHYAVPPYAETKILRCLRGALQDVLLDLRRDSPTFGRHMSVRLEAASGLTLRVPPGIAHGYQTLEDETEVLYLIDAPYHASAQRVLRPTDPALAIRWPMPITQAAERDLQAPLFADLEAPAT